LLTDTAIRNAKPKDRPYKMRAGKGLYLEVRPTGKKLWRYRYRLDDAAGKRRENLFAMGEYGKRGRDHGEFTLDEAQEERSRLRQLVREGKHPSHERRARQRAVVEAQANTFRTVAADWIAANQRDWSPTYLKQVKRGLDEDVYTTIGDLPITGITPPHLLKVVKAKAKAAPTVALLLRQWMGAVFRFAIGEHKATNDPSSAIRRTVKRAPVKNKEPLRDRDIPAFRTSLGTVTAGRPTKLALEILMYTFVRPGELRMSKWREFDLEAALWRIPAERMKMGAPHTVPLATQVVERLRELQTFTGGEQWLFPNTRDSSRCMTATTLNRVLERMGYLGRFSAHGFRATASTWLNETGYRPDVIERQLAHKERNAVRGAYNRAEYLPERRQMMQDWANAIDAMSVDGKVTSIGSTAKAVA